MIPSPLVDKLIRYGRNCAVGVAVECLVPSSFAVHFVFVEQAFNSFWVQTPDDQRTLCATAASLPEQTLDQLAREIAASVDLSPHASTGPLFNLVKNLLRDLGRVGRNHSELSLTDRLRQTFITGSLRGAEFTPVTVLDLPHSRPHIPGYDLRGQLGMGGTAIVYLARHVDTEELRAVKVIHTISPQRFDREVAALRSVDHVNVVRYLDHGTLPDNQGWIAMEYAGPQNLADRIASAHPSPQLAISIARQILLGLDALHSHKQRLIHRDLSPRNIMINADNRVRLVDCGLVRGNIRSEPDEGHFGATLTTPGQLLGTPHYMSPEQVNGEKVTPSTDIWSLGIILYELFVGASPYSASTLMSLGYAVKTEPFDLHHHRIPPEMRSFLKDCLNRDPKSRIPDARSAITRFANRAEIALRRLCKEHTASQLKQILQSGLLEEYVVSNYRCPPVDAVAKFGVMAVDKGFRDLDSTLLSHLLEVAFERAASLEVCEQRIADAAAALDLINTHACLREFKSHQSARLLQRRSERQALLASISSDAQRTLAGRLGMPAIDSNMQSEEAMTTRGLLPYLAIAIFVMAGSALVFQLGYWVIIPK